MKTSLKQMGSQNSWLSLAWGCLYEHIFLRELMETWLKSSTRNSKKEHQVVNKLTSQDMESIMAARIASSSLQSK